MDLNIVYNLNNIISHIIWTSFVHVQQAEEKYKNDIPDWWKQHLKESLERAEECLKTNYYGTRDVTEALIPLLRSSISGRVVNVSSNLGQLRASNLPPFSRNIIPNRNESITYSLKN